MSLAALMTEPVQILRRTVTGEDSSGVEEVAFPLLDTVDAFVARQDTTEDVGGRDLVTANYTFFLPAGTDVRAYDRLSCGGMLFEVTGLPRPAVSPGQGEQFRVVRGLFLEG